MSCEFPCDLPPIRQGDRGECGALPALEHADARRQGIAGTDEFDPGVKSRYVSLAKRVNLLLLVFEADARAAPRSIVIPDRLAGNGVGSTCTMDDSAAAAGGVDGGSMRTLSLNTMSGRGIRVVEIPAVAALQASSRSRSSTIEPGRSLGSFATMIRKTSLRQPRRRVDEGANSARAARDGRAGAA